LGVFKRWTITLNPEVTSMTILKFLKYMFLLGCLVAIGLLFLTCQSKKIATQEWGLATGAVLGLVSALGLVITRILIKQKE